MEHECYGSLGTFAGGPAKTTKGELREKTRLSLNPKMFATGGGQRFPIMLFKRYLKKRPSKLKKSGPFYFTLIDKPASNVLVQKNHHEEDFPYSADFTASLCVPDRV